MKVLLAIDEEPCSEKAGIKSFSCLGRNHQFCDLLLIIRLSQHLAGRARALSKSGNVSTEGKR